MIHRHKHAVVLGVISLALSFCKDSGQNLSGTTSGSNAGTPVLVGSAQASESESREISLVSLAFPYTEGIGNLSTVVNLITGKPIPYQSVVWGGKVIVTLHVPKNIPVNPNLVFDGGASFTAILEPNHSLSTFDGLAFGDDTMFLEDYRVEIELKEGIQTVIAPSDFDSLWTGERIVKGARATFTTEKEGYYNPSLVPKGTVAVKKGTAVLNWETTLELGDHESASLIVVAPTTDTETMSLSVVAR